jgi:predicted nuclease of predicted toxin-antitoxin system
MKFKIDQNLPVEAVDLLVASGHDALTVYQQQLGGAPDRRIVDVCLAEGRILVTADLDLSDIRLYPPAGTPGYVVLRTPRQSKPALLALLARAIAHFEKHAIIGRLWIVEPNRLRIRGGD